MRAAQDKGEEFLSDLPDKPILIVKDRHDRSELSFTPRLPTIDPKDLIGRTFLTHPNETLQRFRAKITRRIIDDPSIEDPSYENVKFLIQIDDSKSEEIVTYNDIIQHLNKDIPDEFSEDGKL